MSQIINGQTNKMSMSETNISTPSRCDRGYQILIPLYLDYNVTFPVDTIALEIVSV